MSSAQGSKLFDLSRQLAGKGIGSPVLVAYGLLSGAGMEALILAAILEVGGILSFGTRVDLEKYQNRPFYQLLMFWKLRLSSSKVECDKRGVYRPNFLKALDYFRGWRAELSKLGYELDRPAMDWSVIRTGLILELEAYRISYARYRRFIGKDGIITDEEPGNSYSQCTEVVGRTYERTTLRGLKIKQLRFILPVELSELRTLRPELFENVPIGYPVYDPIEDCMKRQNRQWFLGMELYDLDSDVKLVGEHGAEAFADWVIKMNQPIMTMYGASIPAWLRPIVDHNIAQSRAAEDPKLVPLRFRSELTEHRIQIVFEKWLKNKLGGATSLKEIPDLEALKLPLVSEKIEKLLDEERKRYPDDEALLKAATEAANLVPVVALEPVLMESSRNGSQTVSDTDVRRLAESKGWKLTVKNR